jgi:hypothetical protein
MGCENISFLLTPPACLKLSIFQKKTDESRVQVKLMFYLHSFGRLSGPLPVQTDFQMTWPGSGKSQPPLDDQDGC